jgi:heparanase 1
MDHLGLMARSGVRVVMRQSLVGGDYGLLDPHTLEPRPDYWSSLLWTALMGEAVYATRTRPSRKLRVYAHAARHRRGAICLLVINLGVRSTAAVSVDTGSLGFPPRHLEVFTVTASDPFSTTLLINGEKPRLPTTRGTPPAAPHVQAPDDVVAVPPLSYSFVLCVP